MHKINPGLHPLLNIRSKQNIPYQGIFYFELNNFNLFQDFFDGKLALQVMEKAKICISQCAKDFGLQYFGLEKLSPGCFLLKYRENTNSQKMTELIVKLRPILNSRFNNEILPLTGQKMKFLVGQSSLESNEAVSFQDVLSIAIVEAQKQARSKINLDNLASLKEFREILGNEDLRTVYQPIVNMNTGKVNGWEALTRGPSGSKFSSPLVLFDFAEEEGQLFALENVCRELAVRNVGRLDEGQKLFLNVHPNTLTDPGFRPGKTLRLLEKHGLSPKDVVFEITERHSLKDLSLFQQTLKHYRQQGYQIAIDDVGAGYSGLYNIAEIRPDILKIDRDLIRDINSHPAKRALLDAFIGFANNIEATVIAEGIENSRQLHALMDMGFHCGQGFYLGHPKNPKAVPEVETLNRRHPKTPVSNSGVSLTIGQLAEKTVIVDENTKISEVKRTFEQDEPLCGIVVCQGNQPCGLIMSHHLDRELSSYYGPALYYGRDITKLMDQSPLIVDEQTPTEVVARQAMQRDKYKIYDHVIITRNGRLLGTASVQDILDTMAHVQVELAKGSNPLSGLPGNLNIETEIEKRVQNYQQYTSIIYVDLDNFKAYNDVYGFKNGDKILLLTSRILSWAAKRHGAPNSFVGHIGGDDFILLTHPEHADRICQGISRCFKRLIRQYYSPSDLKSGYILSRGREDIEKEYSLVSISMAIVDCFQPLPLSEICDLASGTKKLAKSIPGNSYVHNRRQISTT